MVTVARACEGSGGRVTRHHFAVGGTGSDAEADSLGPLRIVAGGNSVWASNDESGFSWPRERHGSDSSQLFRSRRDFSPRPRIVVVRLIVVNGLIV